MKNAIQYIKKRLPLSIGFISMVYISMNLVTIVEYMVNNFGIQVSLMITLAIAALTAYMVGIQIKKESNTNEQR